MNLSEANPWNEASSQTLAAPRKGSKVPPFVSIFVVLIVVAAAAWLLWSQIYRLRSTDLSQFEPNDTPSTRARARFVNRAINASDGAGVLHRADGTGDVHLVGARARFSHGPGGEWVVNSAYIDQRFIPANDRLAVTARFNAINAQGSKADVTPDQIQKLKDLNITNEMTVSESDRKSLADLWTALSNASDAEKPAAEKKLIDAFRQIASNATTPTIRTAAANGDKIRTILSATQITALSTRRAG